jgi:hypothetical protein
MRLRMTLRNADLAQATVGAVGTSIVEGGRVDIDANLATNGQNPSDMIARLGGDVALKTRDSHLSGIDFKVLSLALGAIDRLPDLPNLFRSITTSQTKIATLDGNFHVENGVARSDDIRLSGDGGEGRGGMSFDLPAWMMTSRIEFRLVGLANLPSLVLHLDGPIDEPRKFFDTSALERILGQRLGGQPAWPQRQ